MIARNTNTTVMHIHYNDHQNCDRNAGNKASNTHEHNESITYKISKQYSLPIPDSHWDLPSYFMQRVIQKTIGNIVNRNNT